MKGRWGTEGGYITQKGVEGTAGQSVLHADGHTTSSAMAATWWTTQVAHRQGRDLNICWYFTGTGLLRHDKWGANGLMSAIVGVLIELLNGLAMLA